MVTSDSFTNASVLFADLVDFTSLSARLDPTQVIGMLNDLFGRFDRIVARRGRRRSRRLAIAIWPWAAYRTSFLST